MNGLPFYKAYPRDFIEGTIGWSFEMKGAYRLVLDLIYMQAGKLPDDAGYICGLLGCTKHKWASLRKQLLDSGKIAVVDGFLVNSRAFRELKLLEKYSNKQRENASGPRKNNDLQKPRQNHTEPDTDTEVKKDTSLRSVSKKGTRLPDGWMPSPLPDTFKTNNPNVTRELANRELPRFRDYWTAKAGKDATKVDWDATWRNWLSRAGEKAPPRQSKLNLIHDWSRDDEEITGSVVGKLPFAG